MEIRVEITSWNLKDMTWSGGRETVEDVENAGKLDELMEYMEEVFWNETPTMDDVNNWLWFEDDDIYDRLGMDSNGNLKEDDEDEDYEDEEEEEEDEEDDE